MITPAQYWISGGSLGGGFGRSVSVELGRNVNLSTNENTLVCLVELGAILAATADAVVFAFSFPLLDPNALKNPCSFGREEDAFSAAVAFALGVLGTPTLAG